MPDSLIVRAGLRCAKRLPFPGIFSSTAGSAVRLPCVYHPSLSCGSGVVRRVPYIHAFRNENPLPDVLGIQWVVTDCWTP